MEPIDFIITWVDNNDPNWLAEKNKWEDSVAHYISADNEANAECRFRSNDEMLRYWFRAVDKFAPWVNKIHFVTCGQKPYWLNENHPKLHLVNHKDYIPSQYLPTFNSNTIELNFHRIKELSEKFVYFNDDVFLLKKVDPKFFFKEGKPVLDADLRYTNVGYNNWSRILFNDYCIINKSFDVNKSILKHWRKWFSLSALGYKRARRNFICYLANRTLPVGLYGHIALPHLKSTLDEVWKQQFDVMDQTCRHRFRNDEQLNQYFLCAWNQINGCFSPINRNKIGIKIVISPETIGRIFDFIQNKSLPLVCLNDSPMNTNPELCEMEIIRAFESILPERTSFEI